MMSLILGYENNHNVDKAILGFMFSISPPIGLLITKFHYDQYIVDIIHFQLSNLHNTKCFHYQYYLLHMVLYYKSSHF